MKQPTPPNTPRPAAFLEVKHTIMRATDIPDILRAEKMIDRYIYDICEKPMRLERKADLVYILNFQKSQIKEKESTTQPTHRN